MIYFFLLTFYKREDNIMNNRTVKKAALLAIESCGDYLSTEEIYNRVLSWYINTDVTDIETLAACAIRGYYYPKATYKEMLNAKEMFFPSLLNDNISIIQIESAQRDSIWM